MVEETKILKDDADPPAQRGEVILRQGPGVVAKNVNGSARWPKRQQHQTKQRGFSGAGRTCQELKALWSDGEIEVANDLRSQTVAQTDVFKPYQRVLRAMAERGRFARL